MPKSLVVLPDFLLEALDYFFWRNNAIECWLGDLGWRFVGCCLIRCDRHILQPDIVFSIDELFQWLLTRVFLQALSTLFASLFSFVFLSSREFYIIISRLDLFLRTFIVRYPAPFLLSALPTLTLPLQIRILPARPILLHLPLKCLPHFRLQGLFLLLLFLFMLDG